MSAELPERPDYGIDSLVEILSDSYGISHERAAEIIGSDVDSARDRFDMFTETMSRLERWLISEDAKVGKLLTIEDARPCARAMFFGELNETLGQEGDRMTSPFKSWEEEGPVRAMEVVLNYCAGSDELHEKWDPEEMES